MVTVDDWDLVRAGVQDFLGHPFVTGSVIIMLGFVLGVFAVRSMFRIGKEMRFDDN
jgi:hypothetical protein